MSGSGPADTLAAALAALNAGRFAESDTIVKRLLEADSNNAQGHHLAGVVAMLRGRPQDAVNFFSQAIMINPRMAQAYSNLGLARLEAGFGEEAVRDCAEATRLAPGQPELRFNLAVAMEACGRWREAEAEYRTVCAARPDHSKAQLNLGAVLHRQGKKPEAEAVYRTALETAPDEPALLSNLGHLLLGRGEYAEAERCFRAVITDSDAGDNARAGLAATLRRRGDIAGAIAVCREGRAEGQSPDLFRQLGMALMEDGKLAEAVASFERGVTLKRGPAGSTEHTADQLESSLSKLRHDLQQLDYLAARQALPADFAGAPDALRKVLAELPANVPAAHVFTLPFAARRSLDSFYNRMIYRPLQPAQEGGALNPGLDPAQVQADYHRQAPGLTVVDNFLRPAALRALRKFCLESTLWFDYHHPNGYLGAYLEEGFCCPLLLQVAEDLRQLMPQVIGALPLRQLWAYKYDSHLEGIEMHADFAAVNVNFWITPDAANQDPEGGGMLVWNREAPADWDFKRYNSSAEEDQSAIRTFLEQSGADSWRIPHRENRAVIFNSGLFHRTDEINFGSNYEQRRINITMLFGARRDY